MTTTIIRVKYVIHYVKISNILDISLKNWYYFFS